MAEEIIVRKIVLETDGASKNLDKLGDSSDKVGKQTGELQGQMTALPGPLGKAQAGVKALSAAFKALLANPIVLLIAGIVLALTSLFKAFTKTQEGANKMNDAMEGLKAIVDVLVERMAMLFKALVKIFKGDFKGGFDEMRESVKGVGAEMKAAAQDAIALEIAIRDLYNAETDLLTVNAERRRQLAEQLLITRDLTLAVDERREAVIRASAIENEMLADNIKMQQQRLDNITQEMINTPVLQRTDEQRRKIAEEAAKLSDLQTKSLRVQKKLKTELNTLDMEAERNAKAITDARLAEEARLAKEAEDRKAKETEDRKAQAELDMDFEQDMRDEELAREKEQAEALRLLNEENTQRAIDNAEKRFRYEEEQARKAAETERLLGETKKNIYSDSLTATLGFMKEGSKLSKAVQIGDATKSAIQGAINAYTSTLAIGPAGVVLAPFAAAAALGAGMANVKKIATTPDPLGGSASVPSVSLSRPASTISGGNLTNAQQGIPNDVNIIQDRTVRPYSKSYVVQSELTAAQDIERQRQESATL